MSRPSRTSPGFVTSLPSVSSLSLRSPRVTAAAAAARGVAMRSLMVLRQLAQRNFSSSSRLQLKNRVPELQKVFQEDNGLPVHLKGGVRDAVLYRVTMTLTVVGTGIMAYQLFQAAMPQNK